MSAFGLPSSVATAADEAGPLLCNIFENLDHEHDFEPLRIEGDVPPELVGTFVRNGAGIFDTGVAPHWFDGTGAVAAVRVTNGTAEGAVKVVHSPSADHDRGRATPRFAGFGQRMSVGQRVRALFGAASVRNTANINVLPWQGRLFALYEAAPPVELDPRTLASLGETDLDGVILGAWNAHPRRVPARATTYQFGLRIGLRVFLDVYALPDQGSPRCMVSIPMPGVAEVHDVFATERHLVFVVPPYFSSSLRLVVKGSFGEALIPRPGEPTRVYVVPIDEPEHFVCIETEPFFLWHGFNAYESGDRIVCDFIRYAEYPAHNAWICATAEGRDGGHHGSTVCRGTLDLGSRRISFETIGRRPCEFPVTHPAVHGKPHRLGWSVGFDPAHDGHGWFDRILRHDLEAGTVRAIDPGPRVAVGEPVVVPRSPREDDVWLMSFARDLERRASFVGVWDGASMDSEPLAKIWFDQLLPPALHGVWLPG